MQKNGRKSGHKSRGSQASSFPENETRNANNVLLPERNQPEPTQRDRERKKENLSNPADQFGGKKGKKSGKTKQDRMGENKKKSREPFQTRVPRRKCGNTPANADNAKEAAPCMHALSSLPRGRRQALGRSTPPPNALQL